MWCGWTDWKAHIVQGLGWKVASARYEHRLFGLEFNVLVVVEFDCVVSENGSAVMVADFADGEEGTGGKAGETMGKCGRRGKAR